MSYKVLHSTSGNEVWVNTDQILYAEAINGQTTLYFACPMPGGPGMLGGPVRLLVNETPAEVFDAEGPAVAGMIA